MGDAWGNIHVCDNLNVLKMKFGHTMRLKSNKNIAMNVLNLRKKPFEVVNPRHPGIRQI